MSAHERLGGRRPGERVESRLFNAARPTVTLLVESGYDERFWRMYRHESCLIRSQGQGGREAALKKLDLGGDPAVKLLALLDADLDRVEDHLQQRPDVIWTDGHDLETTLLGLPVLEKLVRQHVDPEKLRRSEQAWGETLRARLFAHAIGMGRLRWFKQRERLDALVFRKGDRRFEGYKDCAGDDWAPSLRRVVNAVIRFSQAQPLMSRDLPAEIAALPEAAADQVCNGHDLLGLLHAWLRHEVKAIEISVDELGERLLLACERTWLEQTRMWRAILDWEAANPGFSVLQPA